MPKIRKHGKLVYTEELAFDPSPEYAVDVRPDGSLDHSKAHDPRYEWYCAICESVMPIDGGGCERVDCPNP